MTVPPDRRADVRYTVSDSPLGELFLATTARGLCRVAYGAAGREEEVARCVGGRLRRAPLDAIRRELDEYFDGRRRRFELTLDPRVSPFQLTVLAALADPAEVARLEAAAESTVGGDLAPGACVRCGVRPDCITRWSICSLWLREKGFGKGCGRGCRSGG